MRRIRRTRTHQVSKRAKFVLCVKKLEAKAKSGVSKYNPYAVCHTSTRYHGTSWNIGIRHKPFKVSDLNKGTKQEHKEHPEFTLKQAGMIAKDHLKENPRYYGVK